MPRLRPFFSFYGSKWLLAPHYAQPQHERVIECFAGSAGYVTLHNAREVLLVDKDPVICQVWEFLIGVSESEMLSLPVDFRHVDEIDVCPEAKLFLGFGLNVACAQPCKQRSKWSYSRDPRNRRNNFWSEPIRARVAGQLAAIRHWQVLNASYVDIPDQRATYFVDPPYQQMGYKYRFSQIDFDHLGTWCQDRARDGQVIACEAEGASWLPFVGLKGPVRATHRAQHEALHGTGLLPAGGRLVLGPPKGLVNNRGQTARIGLNKGSLVEVVNPHSLARGTVSRFVFPGRAPRWALGRRDPLCAFGIGDRDPIAVSLNRLFGGGKSTQAVSEVVSAKLPGVFSAPPVKAPSVCVAGLTHRCIKFQGVSLIRFWSFLPVMSSRKEA